MHTLSLCPYRCQATKMVFIILFHLCIKHFGVSTTCQAQYRHWERMIVKKQNQSLSHGPVFAGICESWA